MEKLNQRIMILVIMGILFIGNKGNARASEYKEYIDKKNGFRLLYPVEWNVRSTPDSKDLIKADFFSKNDNSGLQVRIYKKGRRSFQDFADRYANRFKQSMEKHWGGTMKIIEKKQTKDYPNEGFLVSFDFKRRDKKRWFLASYLWPKQDKIYVFQAGSKFSDMKREKQKYAKIARSFKFINGSK